jgi:stage II sporulation protein AA (anti-sigma F factor antagonist)
MLKKNCTLDYSLEGEELRVLIKGEIDHYSAVWVRADIDTKIAEARPKVTSLILSGIDFMDSSGIGLIMGRYARMQRLGGSLKIIAPSDRVDRICRLAGLEKIVTIERAENGGNTNEND